jgi:hypothetical protein
MSITAIIHNDDRSVMRSLDFIVPKYIYFIWLSNISILIVHDEGYSRKALCPLNLIINHVSSISFVVVVLPEVIACATGSDMTGGMRMRNRFPCFFLTIVVVQS